MKSRHLKPPAQTHRKYFQLPHNIGSFRIKIDQPVFQLGYTRRSNPVAVLQRPDIFHMQLHRKKLSFLFFIRPSDVAQTGGRSSAIEHFATWYKSHTLARQKYSAKVLSIVIDEQTRVPWSGCFSQLATGQPGGSLHVEILSHLSHEPVNGRKVAP